MPKAHKQKEWHIKFEFNLARTQKKRKIGKKIAGHMERQKN